MKYSRWFKNENIPRGKILRYVLLKRFTSKSFFSSFKFVCTMNSIDIPFIFIIYLQKKTVSATETLID